MIDPRLERRKEKDKTGSASFGEISIPISVLSDRSVASLEAIVEYMKEKLNLSYHEIAILLKRDDRTVWTCYNRVKKKRDNG